MQGRFTRLRMGKDLPYGLFCLDPISFFDIDLAHVFIGRNKVPVLDQYGGVTAFKAEYGHDLPFKHRPCFRFGGGGNGDPIAFDHSGLNHRMGLGAKTLDDDSFFYGPGQLAFVGQNWPPVAWPRA